MNELSVAEVAKGHVLLGFFYDLIEVFVSALIVVAIIFTFFFRTAGVDGESMNDTLQNEDRLIMYNFCYTPQRGDIVIVNRYHDGDTFIEKPLIKRVIGVAGDTVKVTGDTVYLNGEPLDEPYVYYPNIPCQIEVTVPEGKVFVMGDHRNASNDSRSLGCFDNEDIMGKALWRIFPSEDFGTVY
ncbi:MAG: signal peptidase I [Clostridia bacterium]|nr:signal peptidase I [Clostridia bacterium]